MEIDAMSAAHLGEARVCSPTTCASRVKRCQWQGCRQWPMVPQSGHCHDASDCGALAGVGSGSGKVFS